MNVRSLTVEMEIVCIGNELLIGKVVNTNASWIGKYATSFGISVKRITVVADELDDMAAVFHEAISRRPKFIITTGGLGPTFDDKTLHGLAKALNRPLDVNPTALQMVKSKYAEYSKSQGPSANELTPARIKMATMPQDALPLVNPVGTAPGIQVHVDDTVIIVLPGVPSEMKAIFEESVVPLLRQFTGDINFYEKSIYADKIMESTLAPLIDVIMHDNPFIYVKSHPKQQEGNPHIEIHLSTTGNLKQNPQERLDKAAKELSYLIAKAGGKILF